MKLPGLLLTLVLTWILVIPACARLPTTHYYVLEPRGEAAEESPSSAHQDGLVIGVEAFLVDAFEPEEFLAYRG